MFTNPIIAIVSGPEKWDFYAGCIIEGKNFDFALRIDSTESIQGILGHIQSLKILNREEHLWRINIKMSGISSGAGGSSKEICQIIDSNISRDNTLCIVYSPLTKTGHLESWAACPLNG